MCRKINHSARSSRAFLLGIDMAKSKSPRKQYAPKQKLSREQANKLIYSTIFRASTQAISEEQISALITPFRAQIEALRLAKTDLDGWTRLNEMNLFSFELASRIFHSTNDEEARRQIEPSQKVFEAAAEALFQIGKRFRVRNKFIATGDELHVIRESSIWLNELLAIAPEGLALTALMKAEQDVRDYWRRGEQAA